MEFTENIDEPRKKNEDWGLYKHLCVPKRNRATGAIIKPSVAHVLFRKKADVLEQLYLSTYRGGYGSPEQKTIIRTRTITAHSGAKTFRRQREILDEFKNAGIVEWSLIPAGRKDADNKRMKIWRREEGIEYKLNLQTLRDRKAEADAKEDKWREEKAKQTLAAREERANKVAERKAAHVPTGWETLTVM